MVRKWTLGGTGFALLVTTFVVVACSSKEGDDDDNGNTGATGGTAPMAGKGGGAGTSTTGGTGGTGGSTGGGTTGGTGGTTGGTAGAATGGTAGAPMGGMAGGAMAGGGGMSGYACVSPTPAASCNSIQTWGTFTSGDFGGGLYTYGTITQETTNTGAFHVSGSVTDYSGFGIYFNTCADVSAYTGLSFTLTGTSANPVHFRVQINADEPAQTEGMKGACNGSPGVECIDPGKDVMPGADPQMFVWADFTGGKPVMAVDTKEVIGVQWALDKETAAYDVDLTIDNFTLNGGAMVTECMPAAMGGMGGMGAGGASSGGASSGGAASGGAGAGGAAAGSAGAAMGGAGAGGASGGQGGQSGGRGGGAGAP